MPTILVIPILVFNKYYNIYRNYLDICEKISNFIINLKSYHHSSRHVFSLSITCKSYILHIYIF